MKRKRKTEKHWLTIILQKEGHASSQQHVVDSLRYTLKWRESEEKMWINQ